MTTQTVAAEEAPIAQLLADEATIDQYPTVFTLPGGLVSSDGQVRRDVEVRELTGADEEVLARTLANSNDELAALRWINRIVELGLVSVGGKPLERIGDMLTGDRDFLALAVRMATYGREYETKLSCPGCQGTSDVVFELDKDIPTHSVDDVEQATKDVELRNGRIAQVRRVTVDDQLAAMEGRERTGAERNTVLLARCVVSINGARTMGEQTMRELGIADRNKLIESITEGQPGPQMLGVNVTCPKCSHEFPADFGLVAMFP